MRAWLAQKVDQDDPKNVSDFKPSVQKIAVNFNTNIQNENDIFSINSFRMCENPFAFKGNGRIMSKDYKLKIKTELCKSWIKTKNCPYGNTCAFAHGEHELQKKKHVPSKYKTKLCQ